MAKKKVRITNKKFAAEDETFKNACDKAGIEPTMRQASKYRRKKGLAIRFKNKSKNK